MTGHLEQAANALTTAGQSLPVDQVQAASAQIPQAIETLQQVGGSAAQDFAPMALHAQTQLDAIAAQLADLRQRINDAAQAILRGF